MFVIESKYILVFVTIVAGWIARLSTGSVDEVNFKGYERDSFTDSKYFRHINNNEKRIVRSVTGSRKNCNTWAPWVNENHPSPSHKEDKEVVSQSDLLNFCPVGSITKFECKDNNGEPFNKNQTSAEGKYFTSCYDIHVGVICTVLDHTLKQCPDMSIRYYCSCNAHATSLLSVGPSRTTKASGVSASTTVAMTPKSLKVTSTSVTGSLDVESTRATDTAAFDKLKDGAVVNKQTMLDIGALSIPWWAFVLFVSGVLFVTSMCVTVCLYKKATRQIKMKHTSMSVHPLNTV
ncbi:uncharacterized protein LOC123545740 [Mercenaria mercenaria]|uniref:uncharacterized protein LOC123545740 n=1 Tax=Mercenaria mercenaria TaxID=6596 RepID=UPI00234E79C7|nr:uncharacterized protein LOC123545740 [Mercenaria mercenaria]